MSTTEEIMEVYEGGIQRMTDMVVNRLGPMALYEDKDSLPMVGHVLPAEFTELCESVRVADAEAGR